MVSKVKRAIEEYNMLSRGDSVIVGLSGGADSCALLTALCGLRESMELKIYACHVNHGLRGAEADRDEKFCGQLCAANKVELFVLHADINRLARERHIGTEQCGREVRYEFFAEKARELGAKIATAHTASDNVETVLFNLARGSGLAGLCGIPPVRDNIIRPLILADRSEIEAFCRENGIDFVTDSTNLTTEYNRNKLRLGAVPVLREINPSLESAVSGLTQRLREAEEFISDEASAALKAAAVKGGYSPEKLAALPKAVFSAAVRKLCAEFALIPEAKHIELIRKIVYNGGAVEIKRGIYAVSAQGIFRLTRRDAQTDCREIPFEISVSPVICGKTYKLELINKEEFNYRKKIGKNLLDNSLDYDKIPLLSVFRTRKSGDSITLFRRNVTKSVKKLFTELRLPAEQRDRTVMLACGDRALWIEEAGVCRDCAVSKDTKKILVITRCDTAGAGQKKGSIAMLHKDVFEQLMSEEEIEKTVSEIAAKINEDYSDRPLVVVGVLKGSVMFLADLYRKLELDECQLDFMAASSYGSSAVSSGSVRITKDIDCNVKERDVLIVEDILDTGNTLSFIKEHLLEKGAASVRICTLFDKPDRRKKPIKADYTGKVIDDLFIVGYGLDYSERYRNLPYVGVLRSEIYS